MKTMPFSQIRSHFTDVANDVQFQHERYVLTKNNKPAFALIPIEDMQMLEHLIEIYEDREDVKTYKQRQNEKGTPIEDLWEELGIK